MIQGACHCGAVQWTFEGMPDSVTACNCTVCRRYGVLWAYDYEGEGIKVAGPTSAYVRGDAEGRRRIAVNMRLTDPDPIAHLPVDHFDGFDKFDDMPRDGRCVKDHWF